MPRLRTAGFFVCVFACVSVAAVPGVINIQGVLRDASNNPMPDATYNVTFRIYTASSGGAVLWTEAASVITTNGLFTALMGAITPVPDSVFNEADRWLGIQAQGLAEMSPRVRLASVGYAFETDQWFTNGPHVYRPSGNVGIGTSNPIQKLHLAGLSLGDGIFLSGNSPGYSLQTGGGAAFGEASAPGLWSQSADSGDATVRSRSGRKLHLQSGFGASAITIASSSNVGIGTSTPQTKLEVRGDVRLGGTGQYFAPAGEENLRIIRGTINGALTVGSGFQWESSGPGRYRITFDTPFAAQPSVTATVFLLGNTKFAMMSALSESYVDIDVYYRSDGSYVDAPFSFIAIGPR